MRSSQQTSTVNVIPTIRVPSVHRGSCRCAQAGVEYTVRSSHRGKWAAAQRRVPLRGSPRRAARDRREPNLAVREAARHSGSLPAASQTRVPPPRCSGAAGRRCRAARISGQSRSRGVRGSRQTLRAAAAGISDAGFRRKSTGGPDMSRPMPGLPPRFPRAAHRKRRAR